MSGWPTPVISIPIRYSTWNRVKLQTKPKGPVIPHDTAASKWAAKGCTDTNDLLGVLSFFICQGIPDEHLTDFLEAVAPKAGWSNATLRWAGLLRGRRTQDKYSPVFTNLIWMYGNDQG